MKQRTTALLALLFFPLITSARLTAESAALAQGDALAVQKSLKDGNSVFTPALRSAYLAYAKDKALADLIEPDVTVAYSPEELEEIAKELCH